MHGALLDAELLADVYMAMTRGQDSLMIELDRPHKKIDDDLAMRDAGKYAARVRKKMGLSQHDFSRKIGVPLETIRNWEQGKRAPTGAAKALLRILDRSPELALLALSA